MSIYSPESSESSESSPVNRYTRVSVYIESYLISGIVLFIILTIAHARLLCMLGISYNSQVLKLLK